MASPRSRLVTWAYIHLCFSGRRFWRPHPDLDRGRPPLSPPAGVAPLFAGRFCLLTAPRGGFVREADLGESSRILAIQALAASSRARSRGSSVARRLAPEANSATPRRTGGPQAASPQALVARCWLGSDPAVTGRVGGPSWPYRLSARAGLFLTNCREEFRDHGLGAVAAALTP